MANTTNHNIYYNDNGNDKADILEDMKKLAESVDEAMQSNTISIEQLQEENALLENNMLHNTKKGDIITVQDSAEWNKNKLDVFGYSEQETREGINLWDYESYTYQNTIFNVYRFVEIKNLKANTTYSIYNYEDSSDYASVYITPEPNYNGVVNFLAIIKTTNFYETPRTFTTKDDGAAYFGAYREGGWTEETWNEFIEHFKYAMLTEGTEIKSYEAYGEMPSPDFSSEVKTITETLEFVINEEDTYNFALENGQELCGIKTTDETLANYVDENEQMWIADYLSDNEIHKKTGKVVLDGTENWSLQNADYGQFYLASSVNEDVAKMLQYSTILCSHFFNCANWQYENGIFRGESGVGVICDKFSTLADFKTWLADQYANGTPVTVYYVLSEEETVTYKTEQEEQYKTLQNVYLQKGTNNLYCTNALMKNMSLTYMQDTQSLSDRITALEQVLITDNEI